MTSGSSLPICYSAYNLRKHTTSPLPVFPFDEDTLVVAHHFEEVCRTSSCFNEKHSFVFAGLVDISICEDCLGTGGVESDDFVGRRERLQGSCENCLENSLWAVQRDSERKFSFATSNRNLHCFHYQNDQFTSILEGNADNLYANRTIAPLNYCKTTLT